MRTGPLIFSGSSNPLLAHKIACELSIEVGNADVTKFSDGEVDVRINESVRARDVFIIQSTCYPGNDHLMELLLMIDACKRGSADRVNAVMPYFGYGRQDRQMNPRVPISAKVIANALMSVGVDRIITVDIHAGQIQGFFDIPVDLIYATGVFVEYLRQINLPDPVIVSPDAGGVDRASHYAIRLGGTMALIDRRKGSPAKAKSMHLVGDVEGRNCIIVDDMVDTAATLTEAVDLLVTNGAKSVRAVTTHPVLSGSGVERINRSKITQFITTDTIPLPVEKQIEKIQVVSMAPRLAASIRNVHVGDSVSQLSD